MESICKIAGQRNAAVGAIQRRPAALSVRRNLLRMATTSGEPAIPFPIRVNSRLNAFGCGFVKAGACSFGSAAKWLPQGLPLPIFP